MTKQLFLHSNQVLNFIISQSELFIISSGCDRKIIMSNLLTFKIIRQFIGHKLYSEAIFMISSKISNIFVTGSNDDSIKLWNIYSGSCLYTFSGHKSFIKAILLDTCEKFIFSGSWDHTIRIWNIKTGKQLH